MTVFLSWSLPAEVPALTPRAAVAWTVLCSSRMMRCTFADQTGVGMQTGTDMGISRGTRAAGSVLLQPDIPGPALLPCRSLFLVYDSSGDVAGVPTFRFVPSSMVFANTSVNPANAGFCVPAGNCPGTGVLNVSVCKQGTAQLCLPHSPWLCSSSRAPSPLCKQLRAVGSCSAFWW